MRKPSRSLLRTACASLTLALATGGRPGAAAAPARWLLVSDLHFNPFDNAALVDELARAPVAQWTDIFERGASAPSGYFTDTNYALLRSGLAAMRANAPAPPVVAIAGDFLAHDFPAQFARAEPGRTQPDYERFVDKTIAFLAKEFDAAFPSAQFVVALGNNDGYCGDYQSTPQSPFLQHMADTWEPLVDRAGRAANFRHDFADAGYYTAALPAGPQATAQAVVLNSVYWSAKYRNACGATRSDPGSDPGSTELTWLTKALAAPPGAYRWLVGHIPPGVDQYSSLRAQRPVPFLQDAYARRLTEIAAGGDAHVATFLFGHLHHASFAIVGPGDGSGVPGLVVPSISPVQGSNPAFVTADVDAATGVVRDTTTFALPLGEPNAAWRTAYSFDAAYGRTAFDIPNLNALQNALARDPALRATFALNYNSGSTVAAIVPATWPWYWCGYVKLVPAAYAACVASPPTGGTER